MYSLRHSYSRKSHLAREKDPQKNFFYFNTRTVRDHGCSSRHVLHETIQSLDNPIGESREISEHVVRPSAGFHGTTSREEPLLCGASQHLRALPEERIPEEQPARSAHVDQKRCSCSGLERGSRDTGLIPLPLAGHGSLSLSFSLSLRTSSALPVPLLLPLLPRRRVRVCSSSSRADRIPVFTVPRTWV